MSAPEHDHNAPQELPPIGPVGGAFRAFFALFDNPANVTKLCWGLAVVCVGLAIGGEFIHKHGHFDWEYTVPAFYGLVGFLFYCCIIQTAIWLRKVVMRPEDYYDE